MSLRSTLTLALLALLCGCYHSEQVDLVVHNATIHTMDETGTTTQAMAVRDGRIVEMGPEREIMNRYQAENTVDAAKLHVYPGFIDGHCHFLGYGLNLQKLDLIGTKSWDEVLERLQRFAEAHPDREWLIGRGWDQNDWSTKD
ncbi:MAG: amidohydrolase family protein, partial [Flavobacteriales bacterium]|nr:amidohydrolase family protein [Flavobacteriales bacterium]